jgi:hypothetical protein
MLRTIKRNVIWPVFPTILKIKLQCVHKISSVIKNFCIFRSHHTQLNETNTNTTTQFEFVLLKLHMYTITFNMLENFDFPLLEEGPLVSSGSSCWMGISNPLTFFWRVGTENVQFLEPLYLQLELKY